MSERQSKTRLGLYVTETRDSGYYHVNATMITIGLRPYELRAVDAGEAIGRDVNADTIRNCGDELVNGWYLNNLTVCSQGNNDSATRSLYGWEVRYRDVYAVDLSSAKRMAKTLTSLEQRMSRLYASFGHATTYGGYLARVAQSLGATAIVLPNGKQYGWSYNDNEQRVLNIADGVYTVDAMVRTWADEREKVNRAS